MFNFFLNISWLKIDTCNLVCVNLYFVRLIFLKDSTDHKQFQSAVQVVVFENFFHNFIYSILNAQIQYENDSLLSSLHI